MNSFDNIRTLITEGKIFTAIDKLKELSSSDWETAGRLETVAHTYRALVNFFISDIPDAGRKQMYETITSDLLSICDRLQHLELVKSDSREFYAVARRLKASNVRLIDIIDKAVQSQDNIDYTITDTPAGQQNLVEYETLIDDIFLSIWTSSSLSDEESRSLYDNVFAKDTNMPEIKLVALAALTLALMQEYDSAKAMLLCRIYENSDSERVSARAIVALIITLVCHPVSVAAHTQLTAKLNVFSLDAEFIAEARMVITSIMFARDSDRINSKFKSEILPEIMKLQPEIMKRLGEMNNNDNSQPEINPQWEEMINESGLADRLKEFNDMQEENGDLLMIPFSSLKNDSFFNTASHWFIPFDIQRSNLVALRSDEFMPLISLVNSSMFRTCDSDKYALALGLLKMPDTQRNLMTSQLSDQFAGLEEDRKTSLDILLEPSIKESITFYVRDLYRFRRGYIRRDDFYDPFASPINTESLHVIGEHIADIDTLRFQAEFYFDRGYYKDAVELYFRLEELGETSSIITQKCGYALQLLGRYEDAIKQYSIAEIINPDNVWLLRRLAICYKNINNVEKASEYYSKLLVHDAENVRAILNAGHCLLELNRIGDALSMYYKAQYLDTSGKKALRPLAWCEMLAGNYDKAENLYNKVIQDNPASSDFLNIGHLYFITNRRSKALEYYNSAKALTRPEDFIRSYNDDIAMLKSRGVSHLDITLMLDELQRHSD